MNNTTNKPEGKAGENPYIWLRYATQFTIGGRTHTVEMGIPVPLGASAEVRAQLIREAEAGMDQLSNHVESRVNQMVQHNARPQATASASTPAGAKDVIGPPQAGAMHRAPTPASSAPRPAVRATSEETQKVPIPDNEADVPPTRTYVGASMPSTPRLPGDINGNLTPTQFLQIIKTTWGLTSQQARDLLQVQTLQGMNLREALERLQQIIAQKSGGAAVPNPKPQEVGQTKAAQGPATPPASISTAPAHPSSSPTPSAAPQNPAPIPLKGRDKPSSYTPPPPPAAPGISSVAARPPIDLSKHGVTNDKRPVYRFDEEDELEEDLDDTDDTEERPALSAQERLKARNIINKMQEVRSSTGANPGRLTVLQNVVGSQISEEQLQRLLQAFWGTSTTKKLKVDQVEALISWAKEDDFVTEVEAVLVLLEEE